MNPLPPNADELVSAYLDGQAAPDEVATVEARAELMAQVEALRSLSSQVSTSVTPPPAQKEAHLAAAMGAFDELFGASAPLQSVADPVTAAAPTPPGAVAASAPTRPAPTYERDTTVASLDAARDRRKRRVSIGLIAAAIAAFALLAVFSLGGGGSSEVATSSIDAAADTASNVVEQGAESGSSSLESSRASTDDAADAMSDDEAMDEEVVFDEAMDEEEAMEEAEIETSAGSAEAMPAATLVPAPSPPAAAAVQVPADGAMNGEAAMADEDSEDLQRQISPFFFGSFETLDDVEQQFTGLSNDELAARKAEVGQGIFARCQSEIAELASIDAPTLIGEVSVDGLPREVHVLTAEDGSNEIIVVNPSGCIIESRFK